MQKVRAFLFLGQKLRFLAVLCSCLFETWSVMVGMDPIRRSNFLFTSVVSVWFFANHTDEVGKSPTYIGWARNGALLCGVCCLGLL